MSKTYSILASCVSSKHDLKLAALARFGGYIHSDFAGLLLEGAIDNAWEGYRNNPKHAEQIKQFEEENGK